MKSLNEYGKNDLEYLSHGQEGSAAPADKIGLAVGGYYSTATLSLDTGDYSRLQMDASGNLMVNLAAGESVNIGTMSLGTIDLLKAGSVVVTAGTMVSGFSSYLGTAVMAAGDTVVSGTVANTTNGIIRAVTVVTPAMTGTGTATLALQDSLTASLISIAQAESSTAAYGTIMPMVSGMNWVVTASGTQAAAATVTFGVYYEK